MLKIITLAVFLFVSGPARAGFVDDAVQAYNSGTMVYVAPGASTHVDASALQDHVNQGHVPIFFAVLPESATVEGSADTLPLTIGRRLPVRAAVGVILGNRFRANAVGDVGTLKPNEVASLATLSFNAARARGVDAVLNEWVNRLNGGSVAPATYNEQIPAEKIKPDPIHIDGPSNSHWFLWLLLLCGGGYLAYWAISRNNEQVLDSQPRPARVKVGKQKFTYSKAKTEVCPHYYSGGYYGGRYVNPGYYNDPFWNYMMLSAVLDHNRHDVAPAPHSAPAVDDTPAYSPSPSYGSGGGDFSSGSSGSSGGGDFGSSFDSGGGFSGGGGDFGGGSSGGGDF